jgi:poly(3-hydroxybutyrate) depolymerase
VTKWASGELGETDLSLGALPLCPGQSLADDLFFFDKMVEILKNEYASDAKRFYVTGFSNGANMTARLAAERSEVFAAAAVHAGYLSAFIPPNLSTRPMSMILSVGADDGLFAQATGLSVPISINADLVNSSGVANILDPFLEINGLDTPNTYSEVQFMGLNVGRFFFQNSKIGLTNSVQFFVIPGLAHNYTDILIDPIWNFLKEESIP